MIKMNAIILIFVIVIGIAIAAASEVRNLIQIMNVMLIEFKTLIEYHEFSSCAISNCNVSLLVAIKKMHLDLH